MLPKSHRPENPMYRDVSPSGLIEPKTTGLLGRTAQQYCIQKRPIVTVTSRPASSSPSSEQPHTNPRPTADQDEQQALLVCSAQLSSSASSYLRPASSSWISLSALLPQWSKRALSPLHLWRRRPRRCSCSSSPRRTSRPTLRGKTAGSSSMARCTM